MNHDDLLRELARQLPGYPNAQPPADRSVIVQAERRLGFGVPRPYVDILTRIGNGGFGPGGGLLGLPPAGYMDPDAPVDPVQFYLEGRACDDARLRTPTGLLLLCCWGAGPSGLTTFSYVDALTEGFPVVTDETLEDRVEYYVVAPSLVEWLGLWVAGADVEASMYETVGQRELRNPFKAGRVERVPIRRLRGALIEAGRRS